MGERIGELLSQVPTPPPGVKYESHREIVTKDGISKIYFKRSDGRKVIANIEQVTSLLKEKQELQNLELKV
jgi:hypothetical protein